MFKKIIISIFLFSIFLFPKEKLNIPKWLNGKWYCIGAGGAISKEKIKFDITVKNNNLIINIDFNAVSTKVNIQKLFIDNVEDDLVIQQVSDDHYYDLYILNNDKDIYIYLSFTKINNNKISFIHEMKETKEPSRIILTKKLN